MNRPKELGGKGKGYRDSCFPPSQRKDESDGKELTKCTLGRESDISRENVAGNVFIPILI